MIRFIRDIEIYHQVILDKVPDSKKFLWIATSDLKDLFVNKGKKFVPFLEIISDLLKNDVAIRLIHAKEPGAAFRKDFDRYPVLASRLERMLCPRVHFKMVIIDGIFVYSGSANLTGAGMGARNENKRNFESGFISDEKPVISSIMDQFDNVWMGAFCDKCFYRKRCPDRPDD